MTHGLGHLQFVTWTLPYGSQGDHMRRTLLALLLRPHGRREAQSGHQNFSLHLNVKIGDKSSSKDTVHLLFAATLMGCGQAMAEAF